MSRIDTTPFYWSHITMQRASARIAIAFVTLWLIGVAPAGARITNFEAKLGFDGNITAGTPALLRITLQSDQPFEGELQLVFNNSVHERIPVLIRSQDEWTMAKTVFMPVTYCELRLVDHRGLDVIQNDRPVRKYAHEMSSKQMYGYAFHMLDVSRTPVPFSGIQNFKPFKHTGSHFQFILSHVTPDLLPSHSGALDGIHVIVLGDVAYEEIAVPVRSALLNWVQRGGWLVVRGGDEAAALGSSFLAAWVPDGHMRFNSLEMRPETLNEDSSFEEPDHFTHGASVPPAPRPPPPLGPGDHDVPLGHGIIRFLRYDPADEPYRSSNRVLPAIVNGYDESRLLVRGGDMQRETREMIQFISGLTNIEPPSLIWISVFLLAYLIIVGPMNFWFFGRRGRRELVWVSIPVIVLVFSGSAFAVGYTTLGGKSYYRETTLILSDMANEVEEIELNAGIYAARSRKFEIAFPPHTECAFEMVHDMGGGSNVPLQGVGVATEAFAPFVVDQWSWRHFKVLTRTRPAYGVTYNPTSGVVAVRGDLDLSGGYLLHRGQCHVLESTGGGRYKARWAVSNFPDAVFNALGASANMSGTLIVMKRERTESRLDLGIEDTKNHEVMVIRPLVRDFAETDTAL